MSSPDVAFTVTMHFVPTSRSFFFILVVSFDRRNESIGIPCARTNFPKKLHVKEKVR